MSLLRQLALLVTILMLILWAALLSLDLVHARAALDAMRLATAQRTATQLAARLAGPLGDGRPALIDSEIRILADNGKVQEVTVTRADGSLVAQRRIADQASPVPDWFARLLPVHSAQAQEQMRSSGQVLGTVSVGISGNQDRAALWNFGLVAWWQSLAIMLTLLGLALLMLYCILQPLRSVEAQAVAIAERDYPVQQQLPGPPELRVLVVAMNRLSAKMRAMFEAHADAMKRLRAENYGDALTGLANRRYFDMLLQQQLGAADEFDSGALLLLALTDFNGVNQRLGFSAGDDLLRAVARIIGEVAAGDAAGDFVAARLSGGSFALILPNLGEREAMATGERLATLLRQLHHDGLIDSPAVAHIGIAMYRRQSATQFLAEADTALRAAQEKGPNALHLHGARGAAGSALSATRWSEFLREVIATRNIILHLQPVLDSSNHRTILQYETLLRVVGEDGQLIPAVIFVPMARRLGLIQQIDRLVVTEVLARIREDRYGRITISVNLSPATLQQADFADWLEVALRADPAAAQRIAFEFPEHGVQDNLVALRGLVARIRHLGARFGIDHFGRGFASFGYLNSLKLDYLKIDGSFIRGIGANRDNQFLVDAICKVAHGMDLQVIAEAVETDEEWATLTTLRLDGVQGYGVGMPSEI